MNSLSNETIFSKIKAHVTDEVTSIIAGSLEKKTYNVNDAQVWSNVICDEVFVVLCRSSRLS